MVYSNVSTWQLNVLMYYQINTYNRYRPTLFKNSVVYEKWQGRQLVVCGQTPIQLLLSHELVNRSNDLVAAGKIPTNATMWRSGSLLRWHQDWLQMTSVQPAGRSHSRIQILYQVQTKTLTFHFLKQQTGKLEERQDMPEKLLDKPRMILKYF